MLPCLQSGDYILVAKPIYGPRVFNVFATLRLEQVDIFRIVGLRRVQRNDVLVFNNPYPNNVEKLEMHILKYYVKRCVGLPGDSLSIINGVYTVKGVDGSLGNKEYQKELSMKSEAEIYPDAYSAYPYDSTLNWNIKDFGPLYIPMKGDSIAMNRTNFTLYKRLIEWEQKTKLTYKDSIAFLNNKRIKGYCFKSNYYFMAGDFVVDSKDSRYWGLVPEEYIVGKAWLIWKSEDAVTGKFRWDRFLKLID